MQKFFVFSHTIPKFRLKKFAICTDIIITNIFCNK